MQGISVVFLVVLIGAVILSIAENVLVFLFTESYYKIGIKILSFEEDIKGEIKKLRKGQVRRTPWGIYKISKAGEDFYVRASSLATIGRFPTFIFFGHGKLYKFNKIRFTLKVLAGPILALFSSLLFLGSELIKKSSISLEHLVFIVIVLSLVLYFIIDTVLHEKRRLLQIYEEFKEDIMVNELTKAKKQIKVPSKGVNEYVYGLILKSIDQLPEVVYYMLSGKLINQDSLSIELIYIRKDGKIKNGRIKDLREILRSKGIDPISLDAFLKNIEKGSYLSPENCRDLIVKVIEKKENLKAHIGSEEIIISIKFHMKELNQIDSEIFQEMVALVKRVDGDELARSLLKKKIPKRRRVGWLNISLFDIEGGFWREKLSDEDVKGVILEVRFYGLGGILKYLLDETKMRYNISYIHLEGSCFSEKDLDSEREVKCI